MLASMRKALHKGLLQVVIWVTTVSMVLVFSGGTIIDVVQRLFGLESSVISVNGLSLAEKDFHSKKYELDQRINMIRQQFGPYAQALLEMNGLTGDLTTHIIQEAGVDLLYKGIEKQFSLMLDDGFVLKAIAQQLPKEALNADGSINKDRLAYLLGQAGMTFQGFEKRTEDELKKGYANQLIDAALFVPDFMIKSRVQDKYAARKYAVVTFPFASYMEQVKKEAISNEALSAYYQEHKNEYMVGEKRSVVVAAFDPVSYGLSVQEKEIEAAYEKNKQSYVKDVAQVQLRRILVDKNARQRAIQIKAELVKDATQFAALAKKHSLDKKSAEKGGLLDYMKQQDLDPALAPIAFSLEDGQISDIIETKDGLEIIQRITRKPATYKTLQEMSSTIKKDLLATKFNALFGLDAKKVVKEEKRAHGTFDRFVKDKKATLKDSTIEKSPAAISKYAFGLKEGDVAFYTESGMGYMLKLVKIQPSFVPTLDVIKEKVKEDIYKEKAKARLTTALKKAEQDNSPLAQIASASGAQLVVTSFVQSENKEEVEKLKKQGLPVDRMLNLSQQGLSSTFVEKDGYLVRVVEVKPVTEDEAQKRVVAKDLYLELKEALSKGFIASLAKTAKIKVNNEQFKSKKRA